ncbi:chlorite dismutase family protein [bacterium AH-315-E10]|nr:chlorite dismutase family protein [bacterium AH-315-E10]
MSRDVEIPDLREKGGDKDGVPQFCDDRLFMQLLVFDDCDNQDTLKSALAEQDFQAVLYQHVNNPNKVGLLTFSKEVDFFIETIQPFLRESAFNSLCIDDEFTMFGRTYSMGYEADLNHALFDRQIATALNAKWPWAVWYPLRRSGEFESLDPTEQRNALMEHGMIGRSYAAGDLAHDIRLDCRGLDMNDNDFVIGLTGKDLFPLSKLVQSMRQTIQTSQYLENLGPFFVGKAIYQSK